MIRAEIRRSSDGVQLVVPIFDDSGLRDIVAGPAHCVLGALPDFNVRPENVEGLTDEFRKLWGVRKGQILRAGIISAQRGENEEETRLNRHRGGKNYGD